MSEAEDAIAGFGWKGRALKAEAEIARLKVELELSGSSEVLLALLNEWMECAKYDALMDGPVFKGWDRSGLDRCLQKTRTALANEERK
jgi:hypothetical protein